MSLLLTSEFLGLLVNRLTASEMCCLFNSENLQQPIQTRLSNKQSTFF